MRLRPLGLEALQFRTFHFFASALPCRLQREGERLPRDAGDERSHDPAEAERYVARQRHRLALHVNPAVPLEEAPVAVDPPQIAAVVADRELPLRAGPGVLDFLNAGADDLAVGAARAHLTEARQVFAVHGDADHLLQEESQEDAIGVSALLDDARSLDRGPVDLRRGGCSPGGERPPQPSSRPARRPHPASDGRARRARRWACRSPRCAGVRSPARPLQARRAGCGARRRPGHRHAGIAVPSAPPTRCVPRSHARSDRRPPRSPASTPPRGARAASIMTMRTGIPAAFHLFGDVIPSLRAGDT